jgi:uncharacterized membrane protein
MDDTAAIMTDAAPVVTTYSDPISSFFGGVFFIIIFFLIIVFLIVVMICKGLGIFKDAPPPPPKEKFTDGPPYPHCRTDGALGMF